MFCWKVLSTLANGCTNVMKSAEHTSLTGPYAAKICEDVDVDQAAELAHSALLFNQAQCCCAGSQTFMYESIYGELVEK